jgi:hypothetical protein
MPRETEDVGRRSRDRACAWRCCVFILTWNKVSSKDTGAAADACDVAIIFSRARMYPCTERTHWRRGRVDLSQGVRFGVLGRAVSLAAGLKRRDGRAQAQEHTSVEETGCEAGREGREGWRE